MIRRKRKRSRRGLLRDYAAAVSGIDTRACERLNKALRHAWNLKPLEG